MKIDSPQNIIIVVIFMRDISTNSIIWQDKFLLLSMDALNEVYIFSCLSICNDICHSHLMHGD